VHKLQSIENDKKKIEVRHHYNHDKYVWLARLDVI
jgi:hypothetical protein